MGKLILSTKKSLFPAPEVEIDGTVYQAKPFSEQFFEQFDKLHEAPEGKEAREILKEQVRIIYDIDPEILRKLDLRDLREIIKDAIKQVRESMPKPGEQNPEAEELKNGLKPGETN